MDLWLVGLTTKNCFLWPWFSTIQMLIKSTTFYPYFGRKIKVNITEAKVGINFAGITTFELYPYMYVHMIVVNY